MVRSTTALLLLMALLAPAPPADAAPWFTRVSFWHRVSQVCVGAAHGADIASTVQALSTGRGVEANVFLAAVENPACAGGVKAGAAVGGMLLSAELYKRKPKTAIALNVASCGFIGYIAHSNMNIARTGHR